MPIKPLDIERFPASGKTSIDARGVQPEDLLKLPWVFNPDDAWIDGRWWVEITLENGMVLQKTLPQENYQPDTLASVAVAAGDFARSKGGVNLKSASRAEDVIRRMATSTYRFVLCGWGLRVGYPVPVPGLEKLSDGTQLVPVGRQWARGNYLVANLPGGIPVYFNEWRIPYAVAKSPRRADEPVPGNPALHMAGNATPPPRDGILLPRTPVDDRITETQPSPNISTTAVQG